METTKIPVKELEIGLEMFFFFFSGFVTTETILFLFLLDSQF